MYKLLLVTDQESIKDLFEHRIDWNSMNCRQPLFAATAKEAVELLGSRAIDAIGYCLDKDNARELSSFLHFSRPSLPIFEVQNDLQKQLAILDETRTVLNRLRADFSDEYYDEEAMLTIQRDELTHNMLAGEIDSLPALERGLKLIRARIDPEATSILYEIDLPQGEVYITEHTHAQQRLERALRNNFFGRYVDGIYYAVAVLTPRHIRLVCVPMIGEEKKDRDAFADQADRHVQDTIMMIKEYLDLDMNVTRSAWLDGLRELVENRQK